MLHSVGQVKVPWCLIYICGFLTLLLIVEVSADVENPIVTKTETADYREELTLKPLSKTNLLASFFFETYSEPFNIEQLSSSAVSGNKDSFKDYKHYSTFPRSLGQIIDLTDARELHLRFSQGWWDAEEWGSLPREGSNSGGTGVEAWAFIQANNRMEATTKWSKMVNILSGLFCASFNFLDNATTTFPVKSFTAEGNTGDLIDESVYVLRGALPGEPVCTENLTPFLKLLPCKGKAGISSLLDGHKLFDSQWQSMSIDVATVCNLDTQDCRLRMTQVIDMVIDVPRAIKKKDSPIPVPTPVSELRCDKSKSYYNERNCFPLDEPTEVAWKLSDFFGRPISGACSVALQNGQICSKVPENWELSYDYANDIELAHLEDNCINLPNRLPNSDNHFDLTLSTYNADQVLEIPTPPVYVQRSLTGHGQEHGGVRTVFRNPSLTKSVRLVYFETIPWFMRFFIHTLDVSGTKDTTISLSRKELIQNIHYTPALDRSRPAQFEVEIIIPSGVTAVLSYQFDKSLLFLEEYPPDANFGFYIAPAVLTTIEDGHDRPCTIRTTSLLLSLPTPDFSMPYNVIILTCTVMALTFGSIYNILVKRIVTVAEAEAVMKNTQSYKFIQKAKNFKVALKNLGKKAKEE